MGEMQRIPLHRWGFTGIPPVYQRKRSGGRPAAAQDGTSCAEVLGIPTPNLSRSLLALCTVLVLSVVGCQVPADDSNWAGGLRFVDGTGSRGLVILHQGHCSFGGEEYAPANLYPIADALVAAGYQVAGFEMPPLPHGPPLGQFYQRVLAFVDMMPADVPIYMIGLSGGGWTTSVVTALCPRIVKGYSVAGDLPRDLWGEDFGDWEQQYPPLPYRELYAMAEGRLMHIYNAFDPCCFAYTGTEEELGAPFMIDYTHRDHKISEWAINWITADLDALQ